MSVNKKFIQVRIEFKGLFSSTSFQNFDYDGVKEVDLNEEQVDKILKEKSYSGGSISEKDIETLENSSNELEFYFYNDDYKVRASKFVEELKILDSKLIYIIEEKDWDDWNQSWREHYQKIDIEGGPTIVPSWEKGTGENCDDSIYIYPGMGFGTGGHETTYLCLKLLSLNRERFPIKGRCLDFGCGSGILGIAARKYFNYDVDFCDVEVEALDNCVQNLDLNFEGKTLNGCQAILRERFNNGKYDLIFANILLDVLVKEYHLLVKNLKEGGEIIISGLLIDQKKEYISFAKDLELIKSENRGDWTALLMRKK